MSPRHRFVSRILLFLQVGLVLVSAASCRVARKDPRGSSSETRAEAHHEILAQRDATIRRLEDEVDRREREISQQSLISLEKDLMIDQLERQLVAQQRLLDQAILEVVRVKAGQRSLGGRAEAGSEMAEAEVALKSLRNRFSGEAPPEIGKAQQFLTMAANEFEGKNFGGAIYLIAQAKQQIKIGTLKLDKQGSIEGLEGEVAFAVPLPLTVKKRTNLRTGPGRHFEVIVTMPVGSLMTGYSTKGPWVRVESTDGLDGWVHMSLVTAP